MRSNYLCRLYLPKLIVREKRLQFLRVFQILSRFMSFSRKIHLSFFGLRWLRIQIVLLKKSREPYSWSIWLRLRVLMLLLTNSKICLELNLFCWKRIWVRVLYLRFGLCLRKLSWGGSFLKRWGRQRDENYLLQSKVLWPWKSTTSSSPTYLECSIDMIWGTRWVYLFMDLATF